MNGVIIRAALPGDAAAVREIYRWYVENTAVTYDYETPSEEEFSRRIARTLEFYPWLVAESTDLSQASRTPGVSIPEPLTTAVRN